MARTAGVVVLAVYQPDPVLLARQIESLCAQTYGFWTCRIGLDGSDPAAFALLSRLVADDRRFDVREYTENVGVYRHFERLLRDLPEGVSWVALADQDDVWHETKLARLTDVLAAPGVTVAMCQARLVDPSGRFLGVTERQAVGLHDLLLRNQVTGSLAVFTADVVRRAHPFPVATQDAIHDHWLGLCAAALGEVRLVDECLQDYVQHAGNVLGEGRGTTMREGWESLIGRGELLQRWGWRVSMAQGLQSARLYEGGKHDLFLMTIADGRFSIVLVRTVLASWRRGRIRSRAVASTLAGAWWFAARSRRMRNQC